MNVQRKFFSRFFDPASAAIARLTEPQGRAAHAAIPWDFFQDPDTHIRAIATLTQGDALTWARDMLGKDRIGEITDRVMVLACDFILRHSSEWRERQIAEQLLKANSASPALPDLSMGDIVVGQTVEFRTAQDPECYTGTVVGKVYGPPTVEVLDAQKGHHRVPLQLVRLPATTHDERQASPDTPRGTGQSGAEDVPLKGFSCALWPGCGCPSGMCQSDDAQEMDREGFIIVHPTPSAPLFKSSRGTD